MSAVDVEGVAVDKSGFVRRDKHDAVGDLQREPPVTSAIFPSSFLDVVFLLFP